MKLPVDADDWPFFGKTKLIFYIFCPLPLSKKRSRATVAHFDEIASTKLNIGSYDDRKIYYPPISFKFSVQELFLIK